jgi:2-polyprenyl-3-methyl-5-hydroxy-6-metoxy-1,4-benzoquinol methylase
VSIARDWRPTGPATNLSQSIAVEAAGLIECFQWLTTEEAQMSTRSLSERAAVADELADTTASPLSLRNILGPVVSSAALGKLHTNEHVAGRLSWPTPSWVGSYRSGTVETLRQAFGAISGGRVLDVATGEGHFVRTLAENLRSYVDIIGIDIIRHAKAAGSTFRAQNTHFAQMDAAQLGFQDESFDTVSISSSLHHLENVPRCVMEMKRVLRPEGHLIIRETHRDVRAGPQRTDMYLHRWVAEIDSALGDTHDRTFTRRELVDLVENFGLVYVGIYDISNTDSNPKDETAIQESEAIID